MNNKKSSPIWKMPREDNFYGVSDNAIRKRCKKLNIDWKNL